MAVASTRASLARVPHALDPGQHYHTAGGELVVVLVLLLVLLVMAAGGELTAPALRPSTEVRCGGGRRLGHKRPRSLKLGK